MKKKKKSDTAMWNRLCSLKKQSGADCMYKYYLCLILTLIHGKLFDSKQ